MTKNAIELAKELIKQFEGCRLTAYRDPVGIWTIGYGSTKEVKPKMVITQQAANLRLEEDIAVVLKALDRLIEVPINPFQQAALISFTYNLGEGALAKSTLLRHLNNGDYHLVQQEFRKWVHAGGKVLPGLVKRRKAEAALWASTAPLQPELPSSDA